MRQQGSNMEKRSQRIVPFELTSLNVKIEPSIWNGSFFGNSATLVGSRVYLLGAQSLSTQDQTWTQEVHYLDLTSRSSVQVETTPPMLYTHYSFLVNDSLFVISSNSVTLSLWKFDFAIATWIHLDTPSIPPCEVFPSVCEFAEESSTLVFFGGFRKTTLGIVFALNIDSLTWTTPNTTGLFPGPLEGSVSCARPSPRGTSMFVFGGRRGGIYQNDLHVLHCTHNRFRWSQARLNGRIVPVAYGSIVCLAGTIFVYGGYDKNLVDATHFVQYDPIDDSSIDLSNKLVNPKGNSLFQALAVNGAIFIFGGFGKRFSKVDVIRRVNSDE